jgi:hypothetical protein
MQKKQFRGDAPFAYRTDLTSKERVAYQSPCPPSIQWARRLFLNLNPWTMVILLDENDLGSSGEGYERSSFPGLVRAQRGEMVYA